MIEVMNLGSDIIACSVTGRIERADLSQLLEDIDRKTANGASVRVYAEVGDLSLMNLISLSQEVQPWIERKQLIRQITRAAVVTDSTLVAQGMQFSNKLPDSIELRLFATAEKQQARQWLEA
jgi:hypothetical protein